ncbi:PQQ-binding-like beta-propeller repeat protein [Saccharicrinis sp. FJH54]|uniref:outer membrane protein assembly factor BamB family protein n=1 Tax=Saccharicrinis sp. FJH54 TaxID=3344665 RepID=UPI0035D455A2
MKKLISGTLLLVLCTVGFAKNDHSYDWRGMDRSGVYNETGLLRTWPENGPELLWSIDSGLGTGYSSPIVTDKNIFIAGMQDSTGHMYCYTLDGQLMWDVTYGKEWNKNSFPGARSTPVVKGDKLFMLSGQGKAFCMDTKNGEILWSLNIGERFKAEPPNFGFCESPLLVDDVVIFTPGGKTTALVALKQKDGSVIWEAPGRADVSAYCNAVYFEHNKRKVVATMTLHYLIGVDYETGDSLWTAYSYKNWTDNCISPYYKNGALFISSPYGEGARVFNLNDDASEIKLKWYNQAFDNQIGGTVELNGNVYGISNKKHTWMSVNLESGTTNWQERGLKTGSIIAADGMLYCYGDDGELALVEPSSAAFNIISKFKVFDGQQQFTHPVIADGKLYVRYQDQMKVFNLKK